MKLYQLSEQYNQALTELVSADLPQEAIDDTLEGLKGELEAKANNVAAFIGNMQAEIDAVKAASKKLADRARAEQAKIDGLREYLKRNMEMSEITEIRSPEFILKIKNNPPSVIIDDLDSLPEDCIKIIPETKQADKTAIKKALKEGEVKGAHLSQSTRLEIK